MIPLFLHYLVEMWGWKIPAAFGYFSTRMLLATITSLIVSIFAGPWFIRKLYSWKMGQTIRTNECPQLGELHAKKQDTPTMGGILILFSMLISLLLWMDPHSSFTLIMAVTTLLLGALGGWDDYLKLKHRSSKGLAGRKKLIGQIALASFVALYMLYLPFSEWFHIGDWFPVPTVHDALTHQEISFSSYSQLLYIPFVKKPLLILSGGLGIGIFFLIICVITGTSNAVNLTDGLDGLASGCLMLVAASLSVIAFCSNNVVLAHYLNIPYVEGSGELAIYLAALSGGCLGFLWYNGHPAQVFMGDIGSLTLGGVIGVSAVLLNREFLLLIIGGVFVAEALSVILQVASFRYRNKKRIFLCAPLHHHFEYKGWPETKVVIRFWIVNLLLVLIGIASLKLQ